MPPDRELTYPELPSSVVHVLATLTDAGHEAALVGGCVRDQLLGLQPPPDWDAATSARPEQVAELFTNSTWENRFGTVTVVGDPSVEVTSYRAEGGYQDRRHPDEVEFGVSLTDDLSRRDFTINAMAWLPIELGRRTGRVIDPFGGEEDLRARLLRSVGEPRARFEEDALRLIRAARFAGRFRMEIEPDTERAIVALAPSVTTVSPERVRDELLRILALDPRPSAAMRQLERLGLLPLVLPELAALRGVPQSKAIPGDALDHTLRTVDAIPIAAPVEHRLAALLHDVGKATTMRDGHFIGHDTVGAQLADAALRRLRFPKQVVEAVVGAIGHHMYDYDASWTDAAVRRFVRRTADVDRGLLFSLRRADNAASGVGVAGERNQVELESRIASELARNADLLVHRRLAIDGHDLQRELGMKPGSEIGRVLERLTEIVLDDPSRNERRILLELARQR